MVFESYLARIAQHDRAAFADLYRLHAPAFRRYATGLGAGDREAAADAVDEAFLDIWRQAARFRSEGSAEGWIRRLIRNKVIDAGRRTRERPLSALADPETAQALLDTIEDPADTPETAAERKSAADELHAALARLSLEHREAVWLCYFEDKPLAEIAILTGVPENTVKTRLFHARRQLARVLEQPA